jgi:hypothetical protein
MKKSFNELDLLKKFVKSTVNIIEIERIEDLKKEDYLIISTAYGGYEAPEERLPNVLIWENIYRDTYNYSINRYRLNYDFYHLKYSLEKALKPEVESIVIGSSYALFGIEENRLNTPCVNLALPSQDMYYACLIGRKVINQNSNIKKIFIGTGYYYFFSDLSLCKQSFELIRLTHVYYPLFKDKHNCKELPKSLIPSLYENEVFDMGKIFEFFGKEFFEKYSGSYFVDTRDRFSMKTAFRGTIENKWFELNDVFKEESAQIRTDFHNKSINYVDSYKENIEILNSFVSLCNDKNIQVYLLVLPSTKAYLKYLFKGFKESYMSALSLINGKINFIDFNDFNMFDDKDFVDMDHLDKEGAIKVSEYINNLKS